MGYCSAPPEVTLTDRLSLRPETEETTPHVTVLYVGNPTKWGYDEADLVAAGARPSRVV